MDYIHKYVDKCYKHFIKDMDKSKLNQQEKILALEILIDLLKMQKEKKDLERFEPMHICDNCKHTFWINDEKAICTKSSPRKIVYWCDTCSKYEHKEKGQPVRL